MLRQLDRGAVVEQVSRARGASVSHLFRYYLLCIFNFPSSSQIADSKILPQHWHGDGASSDHRHSRKGADAVQDLQRHVEPGVPCDGAQETSSRPPVAVPDYHEQGRAL